MIYPNFTVAHLESQYRNTLKTMVKKPYHRLQLV